MLDNELPRARSFTCADLKAQLAGALEILLKRRSGQHSETRFGESLSGFFHARSMASVPGVAELIDNLQGD